MKKNNSNKLFSKNFIIITIITFLLYISFQLFPSALPPYVLGLGAGLSSLGWITGLTTIAALIIRPVSGFFIDRYGRKGIFLLGVVVMAIATISFRIFPVVSIILIFRFIHGIGWGAATTASNTLATDNINKNRFGEGMGYFSLAASLALATAPMASLYFKIESVIVFGAVLLILPFILIFFMDIPKVEVKKEKNLSFYEKSSFLPSIIILLVTTTYGAIVTFLPIMGKENGLKNIGLFFTVYALCMLVTRPILGKISDKIGNKVLISVGLVLLLPAVFMISNISSTFTIVLSSIIYGLGYGTLQTCLSTMAVAGVKKERTGAANATFYTGFDAGIGLGSILSGVLVKHFGYSRMFLIIIIFPILALIIFSIFNYTERDKI